jgi:hypothetical protein
LFRAAAEALLEMAADPKRLGARIGFLAVLHTWSQTTRSSSTYPLCRAHRGTITRRAALDLSPTERLFSTCETTRPAVPAEVPRIPYRRFSRG